MKPYQKDLYQILSAILVIIGLFGWTLLAGMNSFVSAETITKVMGGH